MTKEEETSRINKYMIIINELGLTGITDAEDMFLRDYLDGKNGYCVKIAESLVSKALDKSKNSFNESK